MIIKRIFIGILLVLMGCERKDIIEKHIITDFSKPQSLFYTIQREQSIVDYKIKGSIDGSLGYSEGSCFDKNEFSSFIRGKNLSEIDTSLKRRYFKIFADSIIAKGGCEGTQAGAMYCLQFIPGTAKKGKIEVVFREHGYGF
ncbi:hypothetical protein [Runella aurantiaca]|uniref:Lipoprotein n=1 Tax=Runella aurantiaca TaxID=2282308 RepID=A0A369I9K9_9BACT|nr:hypothetical protein [Runella aurantiaca]RDB05167.1 hypothetical protein DVG78_14925 [Runella aurantiaca]